MFHVAEATYAVVSDPVRSEADRAKPAGKLRPVRLDDPFDEGRLPLGHDRRQIAYVGQWRGDRTDPMWTALLTEIETLATPPWVLHRIEAKEAELRTERMRRQQAEARSNANETEISSLLAKLQSTEQHCGNAEANILSLQWDLETKLAGKVAKINELIAVVELTTTELEWIKIVHALPPAPTEMPASRPTQFVEEAE